MSVTVKDMAKLMNEIAPPFLAEKWDNCGLQTGRFDQPVKSVWVALDSSWPVVTAACEQGVDLLITHHPLFISPPASIDFSAMPGRAIAAAARNELSIFSAHTNLDSADGGLNDICAERLGLTDCRVLTPAAGEVYYKLAVFVPVDHEQPILNALAETRAGMIGHYSCCTFTSRGQGRFKPSDGATPYIGSAGEISVADEVRIETVIAKKDLATVVSLLKEKHPYETMAYDVFPLAGSIEARQGIGRIGVLPQEMPLGVFAEQTKQQFGVTQVNVAGDLDMPVKRVAVCSGSGSSLMKSFLASGADVYVSGDLKYHDGMDALAAGRALVDIGHFETEVVVVDVLTTKLQALAAEAGLKVDITGYTQERSPFVNL